MFSRAQLSGRTAILLSAVLQAFGQVAYSTFLAAIPSPAFVAYCFLAAAIMFLVLSGGGVRLAAWKPLLVLNIGTVATFVPFFYALQLIESAAASAINVGVGPLAATLIGTAITGSVPSFRRVAVCLGVLVGGTVLAVAATHGVPLTASTVDSRWLGVLASVVTGCGVVIVTLSSRALLDRGWRSGTVLAHRFYLIVPLSLAMAHGTYDLATVHWSWTIILVGVAVAALGVILPLYLNQIGIKRADAHTVTVLFAMIPVFAFAIQSALPYNSVHWQTALGIGIIFLAVVADLSKKRG